MTIKANTPDEDRPGTPRLGKLSAPYPVDECVNANCDVRLEDSEGAYLFKDLETNKLCVFCDDCARYVELNARERFLLVAL